MRYREDTGEILVSVREAVAFSVFHYLGTAPGEGLLSNRRADAAVRTSLGYPAEGVPLTAHYSFASYTFLLEGTADALTREGRSSTLSLVLLTRFLGGHPSPTAVRAARAEGYLLAHIAGGAPAIRITYLDPESGDTEVTEERGTRKRLAAFFEKAASALALYASSEIARVKERLPKMRALPFPYRDIRLGQEELMGRVYRTVRRGARLYASAPTGIGKTVSTLYPAVRAMGEGYCDKLFYLTAKQTAARVAGETAALLGKDGALRTVMLASKERLCPERGRPCREGAPCRRRGKEPRMEVATAALLALGLPLVTPDEIVRTAREYDVCPHELSLSYSMVSDLVICDYNYLFDPAVRLIRYFEAGGRYAFLIDEAHNLADRVRDTYTATLSTEAILRLSLPEGEAFARVRDARDHLLRTLHGLAPQGVGEEMRITLPEELPRALFGYLSLLYELTKNRSLPQEIRSRIRSFYYEMKTILDIFAAYGEGFRLRLSRHEAGEESAEVLCLDPAAVVGRALSDGISSVLFSATLSPIEYYRDLLGGDAGSDLLSLPSPFERDNLAVCILDKVSTRYQDREGTLAEVAEAVAVTARERRGNYMVFCPSFAYAERLRTVLTSVAPDLRLLLQGHSMTPSERAAFLAEFDRPDAPVLALCVLGGIFGEGVDLVGRRLIGTVIIGVGLGSPDPFREEMARYFADKNELGREYAYLYPGMNRVLQAAGRVIRTEGDVGVVVLVDDRFATPTYRPLLPSHWHPTLVGNNRSLREYLRRFWDKHKENEEGPL